MADQLLTHIQQLRDELAAAEDISEPRRQHLLALIDQMEAPPAIGEDMPLADQIEVLVTEFDVSHPTMAAVIKKLVETLNNMGV